MRKKKYTYSPRPAADYSPLITHCGPILNLHDELFEPVWNLTWLSDPSLDDQPPTSSLPPTAMRAIVRDVQEDPVLKWKLIMHPSRFIEWFEREDHSIYDCYEELGAEQWVHQVLSRACAAVHRLAESTRVATTYGNVTYARFGRKAA